MKSKTRHFQKNYTIEAIKKVRDSQLRVFSIYTELKASPDNTIHSNMAIAMWTSASLLLLAAVAALVRFELIKFFGLFSSISYEFFYWRCVGAYVQILGAIMRFVTRINKNTSIEYCKNKMCLKLEQQ
jgi:hypothetical protein